VNLKKFFAELRRRNVYRVAVAYGVVGWLLIQIATQVFPFFDIPSWAIRLVIVVLLLGFPVALIVAWIYELTPEGLQRTDDIAPAKAMPHSKGRKIDFVIIGVLLAIIAIMAWRHFHQGTTVANPDIPRKSIAILPFIDLSQTRDQDYFSDGITEQIINALSHVHGLLVVARTTAFSFKNKDMDVREIGRQLHVDHMLEGSVNRGPDKVRVVARLIDVANGFNLWSETYYSSEKDLLFLQSDVAAKVASALRLELKLAETTQLAKSLTQDPEAYDLYLRGRYLLNKRTTDSIQKGRLLFEQAVAKDPHFALGHAGIADSYILLGKAGAIPPDEASTAAWSEVSTTLEIDGNLAEGYISRGTILADFDWNWPAAEADFRKALTLNPNSAIAHFWYARNLAQVGRSEEALRENTAAGKLDPLSPVILSSRARILFVAHRYLEAVASCLKAIDLEGSFGQGFQVLALAYLHNEQYPEGIEAAKKYVELSNRSSWTKLELAYAYARSGNKEESDRIVTEVTSQQEPFSPYDMATICAVWRDKDAAFDWLGKAIDQRSVDVIWMRVDPRLDPVRSDARFAQVLARLAPRRQSSPAPK
jgi:serine/threonine-protein kinase